MMKKLPCEHPRGGVVGQAKDVGLPKFLVRLGAVETEQQFADLVEHAQHSHSTVTIKHGHGTAVTAAVTHHSHSTSTHPQHNHSAVPSQQQVADLVEHDLLRHRAPVLGRRGHHQVQRHPEEDHEPTAMGKSCMGDVKSGTKIGFKVEVQAPISTRQAPISTRHARTPHAVCQRRARGCGAELGNPRAMVKNVK